MVSKKWIFWSLFILACLGLGLLFLAPPPLNEQGLTDWSPNPLFDEAQETTANVDPREIVLALFDHYGAADSTIEKDLEIVQNVLREFWLIYKNPDLLPVGSNTDIVRYLSGANAQSIQFIPANSEFIDKDRQLLDRWGSPVIFHPISMRRIETRSAGPDRKAYTDDDVVWPLSAQGDG